jgi:glutamate--cysteine ligase
MSKINTKEELENWVSHNWDEIHHYLDQWQSEIEVPLTSSVDIRESETKIAPVDHNTYPAGFNNICQKDLKNASEIFKKYFEKKGSIKTVGLIPESHTKNTYYLENLYYLKETISDAGVNVILISPDINLFGEDKTIIELETFSGQKIKIHKVVTQDNQFSLISDKSIHFDMIILNHDQSQPLTVDWSQFKTPVYPSPFMGWFNRSKVKHFSCYHQVVQKFCSHFKLNPNVIQAKFKFVDQIDFESKEGIEQLAAQAGELFLELPPDSSLFLKASQGTYGMGISVVKSKEEILSMNRKTRNKMDVGKNNIKFTSVLIQEGIETILKYNGAPAEITVYLINGKPTGGFMRFNPQKGTQANLNSQGMLYQKYCISEIKQGHDYQCKEATYCIIARLAVIASAYENSTKEII